MNSPSCVIAPCSKPFSPSQNTRLPLPKKLLQNVIWTGHASAFLSAPVPCQSLPFKNAVLRSRRNHADLPSACNISIPGKTWAVMPAVSRVTDHISSKDYVRGYIALDQKKNNIKSRYEFGSPATMSCRRRAARCCAGNASTSGRDTHPEENHITRRNALFGAVFSSVLLVSKTSHVRHHEQERYQSCLEMSAPACEAPVALSHDRCVLAACIQSLGSTKVERCSGWGYNRACTLIHHRLPLCSRKEGESFSVTCIIGQAPVLAISHRTQW